MSATIPRLAAVAAAVARAVAAAVVVDGARRLMTRQEPGRVVAAGISGEPEHLAGKQPWAAT
jgi:hypothetical protein